MKIIVDAYNLLFASNFDDRDSLILAVATYAKGKKHEITLVFDGTHQGTFNGDRILEKGIEVVFTPLTETADEWIEDFLELHPNSSFLIVSSDRRVQRAALDVKADYLNSDVFAKRLLPRRSSSFEDMFESQQAAPWEEGREEVDELYAPAKKKGNPRKRSKLERRKQKKLKKL